MIKHLVLSFSLLTSSAAFGQSLLPEGIGLYQLGYRSYGAQTSTWDQTGNRVPLSSKFDKDLTGPELLRGKGGSDLQRLAEELKKYEGNTDNAQNIVDRLDLGQITGTVDADIQAQFLGLGFGVSKGLTLFAGVPFIQASVKASIAHTGENNAAQIKAELGELAFDELKNGLDQAAAISSTQINQNILDAGYEPIDEWSHKGIGDLRLGAKTASSRRINSLLRGNFVGTLQLEVPTGYVEHPDLLTDVNLGKGYFSLGLHLDQSVQIARRFHVGVDMFNAYNMPTQLEKRVPVDNENVIAADRKNEVTLTPGMDSELGVSTGYQYRWFSSSYRLGYSRHFSDTYEGKVEGNYAKLGENTSSYKTFHELGAAVSTAKAFARKVFPIPFILAVKGRLPIKAQNSSDETYLEMSLASFFSTPMARPMGHSTASRGKRNRRNSIN